ncbi:FtsX-like permease family protein [uncultured Chitinophaga sp.]|uniref:ABC transporter permease n=1 Tax=uncultured Chitinophaga sp. TaxID=339340 RepID=UPI0025DDC434|nr:FtsX-like permease family protein [uncultured Chitinophaga sp.]
MLRNYIKIAFRSLWKYKGYSAINILGLALGMACSLLIILHVKDEISYDKGYDAATRLYRVTMEGRDDSRHWAATAPNIGEEMAAAFPEIRQTIRFFRPRPLQVLSYTDAKGQSQRYEEKDGLFAEAAMPRIFDLQFLLGDATTALAAPGCVILTEKLALKYFGTINVLGKVLREEVTQEPLRVTGVVATPAKPSHVQFSYLISMPTILARLDKRLLVNRTWNGFYNYLLLDKPEDRAAIESRMNDFLLSYYTLAGETPKEILANRRLHLQPVQDIHLHSKLEKEMSANSDIRYVYIFSVAALCILLIAAVNFINIFTAQANNRTKEIGLRKVIGAGRLQLARQFLGESLFVTLLSAMLALALVYVTLPFFNDLTGKAIRFSDLLSIQNATILFALILSVGLLAGFYPAWMLSGYNPVKSLQSPKAAIGSTGVMRKGLIVFQFTISVFMIFSTVVMYRQMRLFHDTELGFDKKQLVAVTMYDDTWRQYGALSNELKQQADITAFGITSNLPGERFSMQSFQPFVQDIEEQSTRAMFVDDQLLQAMGLTLVAGNNFRAQWPTIKNNEFILNETAVKTFGIKDPVGKRAKLDTDSGTIVGVVKDFNFASLHSPVDPLVIQYKPLNADYLLVQAKAGKLPATLQLLESKIQALAPTSVFTYTFIDDKLENLYASENRMMQLFKVFSGFAILVSCLGLFGLAAYASRMRTKEIGIRKVLGASVTGVTVLLSRDFMKLVLIAMFIAWPLSWWVMHSWLNDFAYRAPIEAWMFLLSGSLALLVALLTVSVQALKAATVNPVRSLKTD